MVAKSRDNLCPIYSCWSISDNYVQNIATPGEFVNYLS